MFGRRGTILKLVLSDFSGFMLVHFKITQNTHLADAPEGIFFHREKVAAAS